MPILSLQNFLSWVVQISLIAIIGMVLPRLFRLKHPQSHLSYCYVLLLACMVIPFVQPLRHTGESAGTSYLAAAPGTPGMPDAAKAVTLEQVIAWILVCGMVIRLGFFLAGLLRIRHYRATAIPLSFPKESVLSTCNLINPRVAIGISTAEIGPVTFGWRRPVILLPESFLALEEESQRAILCHEFLHVTRHDWLMTVFEEIVGAILWFHPAMWWLLSQTRLAREQLVDAEVIRLTAAREPYIRALLAMAGSHSDGVLLPAPLFLRTRHLSERMRLLLMDHSMSLLRLTGSYASIGVVLGFAACTGFMAFPLMGQSPAPVSRPVVEALPVTALPVVSTPEQDGGTPKREGRLLKQDGSEEVVYKVGNGVTAPKIVTHFNPAYSDAARAARIQGIAVLEGIVWTDGTLNGLKVIRGLDPDLDLNAINTLKQWRFEPAKLNGAAVPVRLVMEVRFNLK